MSSSTGSITTEPDDDEDMARSSRDADSDSLSPEALNYEYLHGRRYHGYRPGRYLLPNDQEESTRMDLLHDIWKMLLGGSLSRLSFKAAKRILDVGTGNGVWAVDVADLCPKAEVIGTDLSPIQPCDVPEKCHFYVDDAEAEWDWDEPFDFIHGRCLGGSISDWPRFYRQCFEHLTPGGSLEMQEHEVWVNSLKDVPPWTAEWQETLNAAFKTWGKTLSVEMHAIWMKEAGFVDVKDEVHQVPIGTWAKDKSLKMLGQWNQEQMLKGVEPYTLAMYNDVLRRPIDSTQVTIEMVKGEFRTAKNHLFMRYHFITGKKPPGR